MFINRYLIGLNYNKMNSIKFIALAIIAFANAIGLEVSNPKFMLSLNSKDRLKKKLIAVHVEEKE